MVVSVVCVELLKRLVEARSTFLWPSGEACVGLLQVSKVVNVAGVAGFMVESAWVSPLKRLVGWLLS